MPSASRLPRDDVPADDVGAQRSGASQHTAASGKPPQPQQRKIPLSAYAAVGLARPLSVFGKTFEVHLSASCTLNPSTALQVVMDTSLLTFLRDENPALLQTVKTLLYAGTGKHRPSETTRKRILQDFTLLDSDALVSILDGQEPPPTPHHSDWSLVLQGMGDGKINFVRDVAINLSTWDDKALEIRALVATGKRDQAHACTEALLGPCVMAWRELNSGLLQAPQVLVLIESSLQTLARLMCAGDMRARDLNSRESAITELLNAGRRPLGHWLHEVQQAADCKNLSGLAQRLLSVGARHQNNRTIGHDLLKKWSSSKNVLMPQSALKPVLRSVRIHERADRLQERYYVARFLTFLCDLTWAGIPDEKFAWPEIQAHIKNRYCQVFRLEAANWPVPA